jgi:hypothetical protein
VAEVCDLDNEPLVKMVGVEHVQTVVSHDIIGRLMIQCARQHGLASVWQNIMGFEGESAPQRCLRTRNGDFGRDSAALGSEESTCSAARNDPLSPELTVLLDIPPL